MNSCPRSILWSAVLAICVPLFGASTPEPGSRGAPGRSETLRGDGGRGDYVLQPQDSLRVHVFQEEDINKQGEVSISQEHTIFLPLIKTISLKGLTGRQAEGKIRDLYKQDYLVNPDVSVVVLKYSERSVNVVGQVNKPDRILFPPERGLSIVDAISLAGGQTRLADLKKVKLTRKNADGETVLEVINVDEIIKSGGKDAVQLQQDDVIFVPERIL